MDRPLHTIVPFVCSERNRWFGSCWYYIVDGVVHGTFDFDVITRLAVSFNDKHQMSTRTP